MRWSSVCWPSLRLIWLPYRVKVLLLNRRFVESDIVSMIGATQIIADGEEDLSVAENNLVKGLFVQGPGIVIERSSVID